MNSKITYISFYPKMNFKISKKYAARATEFKSKEDKVNERISIKLPDLDDDIRDEPEEQSST